MAARVTCSKSSPVGLGRHAAPRALDPPQSPRCVPAAYGGWKPDPRLPPARISWPSVCRELGAPLATIADHTDTNGRALKDLDKVAEPLSHLIPVAGPEPRRLESANEGRDVLGRLGRRASLWDAHRPILSRSNRDTLSRRSWEILAGVCIAPCTTSGGLPSVACSCSTALSHRRFSIS
jgi:hypothetical protein